MEAWAESDQPFEARYIWSGDALDEQETSEFQRGKATALQKLMPYTVARAREAACVVLRANGEELDFQVGDSNAVESVIPQADPVAILHSHPDQLPHSIRDWQNFTSYASIVQSHVVTAYRIYSLHRPQTWTPRFREVDPATIES